MRTPFVVNNDASARFLVGFLNTHEGPVAVDTETLGCDPSKQSPVGTATLWSMQLAWGEPADVPPSDFETAFIPAEFLPFFKEWLEDHTRAKVGSSILSYDRHVFKNHDIELRGVVGCTWLQSKLRDPSNNVEHGLKAWGERLGYEVKEYSSFSRRLRGGKVRHYKKDREVDGVTFVAGAEFQTINWNNTEDVPLDELWEKYPTRRRAIVDYACMDAAMSLDGFYFLREELINAATD